MSNRLDVDYAFSTSAGIKPENQDACAIRIPDNSNTLTHKGAVALVADGVSACTRAREASHTSISSFMADYYSTPDSWQVRHAAGKVITAINSWLHYQGQHHINNDTDLCTTFSGIVLKSNTAHLLHIGDSRIYRLRKQHLECLTEDHTSRLGQRQYLARALGMHRHTEVDYRTETLQAKDVFILTTDGIHDVLSHREIGACCQENCGLQQIADSLVQAALSAGSSDNLTAVICRIEDLPTEDNHETLERLAQLRFPPDLEPGQVLDGYRILETLHASTRSQLYLAEDTDSGQQVVIKTPSVNFEDDPLYLDGFLREEWIGRRVNHPAIMALYAPKPGKQFLYQACEYIQGQTLRGWMQDNPKPDLNTVRDLTRQIVSALRGLHRMQILHQDLKPENLMIDRDGRVRLIDFGAARVAGDTEILSGLHDNTPQGTKNYVAPEYFLGGAIDYRADQFAVGVIVYEMLTGNLPYREVAGNSIRIKHYKHLRFRPVTDDRPDLPEWINLALAKAVAPNPTERYEALSEFCQDLSTPNPAFQSADFQPLMSRNPTLFWQLLCVLLGGINLWQFFQ